ncbi:hypothetical protein V7S43_013873 [Phytophthora oleae]|uniref:Uncharacterized protein n=1 Tax=Phytophthora oleae TaxID=2107226 RepID=A0ABD3F5G2_9STRA
MQQLHPNTLTTLWAKRKRLVSHSVSNKRGHTLAAGCVRAGLRALDAEELEVDAATVLIEVEEERLSEIPVLEGLVRLTGGLDALERHAGLEYSGDRTPALPPELPADGGS